MTTETTNTAEYMTVTEFYKLGILPISKRSLREKCRTNKIPCVLIGGRYFIKRIYAESLQK